MRGVGVRKSLVVLAISVVLTVLIILSRYYSQPPHHPTATNIPHIPTHLQTPGASTSTIAPTTTASPSATPSETPITPPSGMVRLVVLASSRTDRIRIDDKLITASPGTELVLVLVKVVNEMGSSYLLNPGDVILKAGGLMRPVGYKLNTKSMLPVIPPREAVTLLLVYEVEQGHHCEFIEFKGVKAPLTGKPITSFIELLEVSSEVKGDSGVIKLVLLYNGSVSIALVDPLGHEVFTEDLAFTFAESCQNVTIEVCSVRSPAITGVYSLLARSLTVEASWSSIANLTGPEVVVGNASVVVVDEDVWSYRVFYNLSIGNLGDIPACVSVTVLKDGSWYAGYTMWVLAHETSTLSNIITVYKSVEKLTFEVFLWGEKVCSVTREIQPP